MLRLLPLLLLGLLLSSTHGISIRVLNLAPSEIDFQFSSADGLDYSASLETDTWNDAGDFPVQGKVVFVTATSSDGNQTGDLSISVPSDCPGATFVFGSCRGAFIAEALCDQPRASGEQFSYLYVRYAKLLSHPLTLSFRATPL